MLAHSRALHRAEDNVSIVLLHGFLGDRRDVEPLRANLDAIADCISVDLPGHGDSAWMMPAHAGASVDALLATLEALRPAPRRLLLIGYSMGARVALQLAARLAPPRLAGLVILSGNPGVDDETMREQRLSRDAALAARLRMMTPPQFAAWLRDEWYRAALWGMQLQSHPQFESMMLRRTEGARPSDRAEPLERESVGQQPSYWDWLEAPPVPVLYVAGKEDAAYSQVATTLSERSGTLVVVGEGLEKMDGSPRPVQRHLRVVLLPDVGHALLTEAFPPVAELCRSFAKEVLATPSQPTLPAQPPLPPPPMQPALPSPPAATSTASAESMSIEAHRPEGVRSLAARLLPFRLPLTAALPLARGAPLIDRAGVLLLLEGVVEGGRKVRGLGEICPLPGFHSESLDQATEQLGLVIDRLRGRELPEAVARLDGSMSAWLAASSMPALLPSVRCAVEMACLHLLARAREMSVAELLAFARQAPLHSHVRLNGLLARGEASGLEQAAEVAGQALLATNAAEAGLVASAPASGVGVPGAVTTPSASTETVAAARMRTWKVKVGGVEPAEDGRRIGKLLRGCTVLGLRLRLDANQAWTEEQAATFCEALRTEWAAGYAGLWPSVGDSGGADSAETSSEMRSAAAAPWPPPALEFCEEPLRPSLHASLPTLHAAHGLRHAVDESALAAAAEALRLLGERSASPGDAGEGEEMRALRARLADASCAALVLKPTLAGGLEVSAWLAAEASALGKAVVLTSAFESGVAHAHVAMLAAVLGGASTAHGLSTYERLESDVLSPSFAQSVGGDLASISTLQAALDATADALPLAIGIVECP